MKNVLKKIVSVAMAFTLLGTGVAISNSISPESNNTLVASARCKYCGGGREYESMAPYQSPVWDYKTVTKIVNGRRVTELKPYIADYTTKYGRCRKCYSCNKFLYWC